MLELIEKNIFMLKLLLVIGLTMSLLIIIIELIVSKINKQRVFTLSDSITNLLCGMLERCSDIFWAVFLFYIFYYVYNTVPWKIPSNPISWVLALFVTDFIAYWHHRLAHEINFLWAIHSVHHQSEELNTTTVFRVSFFGIISRSFFFIFMPFLGFSPYVIASTLFCIGFYSFFTHNRFVKKIGFLEKIMVTPSHHRVHHAYNIKYLDKNYGHIFIIWDKLFGTFMKEDEEPNYGITSGFESSNIFKAQFFYWQNLFNRASRTKGVKNKVAVFVKSPEFTPKDVEHHSPEYKLDPSGDRIHYRQLFGIEKSSYILINVLSTVSLFILLTRLNIPKPDGEIEISIAQDYMIEAYELLFKDYLLALVALILFSIFSYGYFLDQKKGYEIFECIRLVLNILIIPFVFSNIGVPYYASIIVIVISVIMILWLLFRLNEKTYLK